jgi:hypothetical protein
MNTLASRWNQFLFEPRSARDLGICRFLFLGLLLLLVWRTDYSLWSDLPQMWHTPLNLLKLVPLPVFSPHVVSIIQAVWKASLLLGALGLLARPSVVTAAILGFYLLLLEQSLTKVHQNTAIIGLALVVLATSRCCDEFTLDGVIRKAWKGRDASFEPKAGEAYGWPCKIIVIFLSAGYFLAGYSKLATSGPAWIFSDNFKNILIEAQYGFSSTPPLTGWGAHLAGFGTLCVGLAAATMAGELLYPLALFNSKLRWVLVPAALFAHVMVLLLVGPRFFTFMIASVFWVHWDAVEKWTRQALDRSADSREPSLIADDLNVAR